MVSFFLYQLLLVTATLLVMLDLQVTSHYSLSSVEYQKQFTAVIVMSVTNIIVTIPSSPITVSPLVQIEGSLLPFLLM